MRSPKIEEVLANLARIPPGVVLTVAEAIRMGCVPEILLGILSTTEDELTNAKAEIVSESRYNETLYEQVYHAKKLLDQLEEGLKEVKSAAQARKLFAVLLDQTFFER
jgi:F0F1-type ATP synthase delta subunit